MAMSLPRPDPSSPSSVAAAAFATSRKGYEPAEVRDFLRMVAAELARLQERERFLERELRNAQRATSPSSVALDDELVTKMLGEEAARILHTARDAASQIKVRAEEGAARLLREANDEAQRMRQEAEIEAARRRHDAAADAEAELEMAKQQGREMVNEARAYRERVLGELARRREIARQQIEQLVHGRDRLLQAFERARLVSMDVMAELTPLGEPEEYVDLSPTTGPVPLMVKNAPRPDEAADDLTMAHPAPVLDVDLDEPDDDPGPDGTSATPTAGRTEPVAPEATDGGATAPTERAGDERLEDAAGSVDEGAAGAAAAPVEVDEPAPATDEAAAASEEVAAATDDERGSEPGDGSGSGGDRVVPIGVTPSHDDEHPDDDAHRAPVVHLFGEDRSAAGEGDGHPAADAASDDAPSDGTAAASPPVSKSSADDLFARLRAARAESVVARASQRAEAADADGAADETVPMGRPAADEPAPAAADETVAMARPAADDSVFAATPAAPEVVAPAAESTFARRDEVLTPLIVASARKLKRVLADEQNEVLHVLRGKDVVRDVGRILPSADEQASRYAGAVGSELTAAAVAGAVFMGATVKVAERNVKRSDAVATASASLVAEVVAPLRQRLERAVADAGGDNGELASLVRAVYREWKTQQIDEHLDDVARTAYGRGALAGVQPGTPIRWVVDPEGPECPDAEDNTLGGVVAAGDPFPTEHPCAPAHSGCRCMIVRADAPS